MGSEEGAALSSRLLGTHRIVMSSRVVQAAVMHCTMAMMSPRPGLQPSLTQVLALYSAKQVMVRTTAVTCSAAACRKQILNGLSDLLACKLPEDK